MLDLELRSVVVNRQQVLGGQYHSHCPTLRRFAYRSLWRPTLEIRRSVKYSKAVEFHSASKGLLWAFACIRGGASSPKSWECWFRALINRKGLVTCWKPVESVRRLVEAWCSVNISFFTLDQAPHSPSFRRIHSTLSAFSRDAIWVAFALFLRRSL